MQKITSNYFFVIMYHFLTVITPIFTTPYVSRVLGPKNIGIDAYVNSIVQIFMVFIVLNIGVYGRKQIASAQSKKEIHTEFCAIYSVQCMTTIIVLSTYIFYIFQINNYHNLFWMYGITLIATGLDVAWYFIGLEKVKQIMIRNSVIRLLTIVSIFIFVRTQEDLWKFVLISSLSLLFGQFITWSILLKEIKQIKLSFLGIKQHIRSVLVLSIIPCVSLIYMSINKIYLGHIVGNTAVGFYNQAYKLIIICMGFINALSTVMMPRMVNHYTRGEKEEFKEMIEFSIKYTCITTLPIMVMITILAKDIIQIFLGSSFSSASNVLIALAPGLVLAGLSEIFGVQILLTIGKEKPFTLSVIIGAFISLSTNFLLVTHLHSIGTAIAFDVGILTTLLVQVYSSRNFISLPNLLYGVLKYGLFSVCTGAVIICIDNLLVHHNEILTIGVKLILAAITYMTFLLISKDKILSRLIFQIVRK
ncbi:oligosaccharide flippase family protein [Bacillus cereus group sp. RP43]|uniref:oligosaccharide flippase family protein n=1 Tax=Bacillus cereus group sp. RP43 TaxID=3040260 RepID=UPI0033928390